MIISLIAAMDKNRLIGRENGMPWHLPADFNHFKDITLGKPVIMGRKTFESLGKPLPGRKNIVVSRTGYESAGAVVVSSIDQAIAEANNAAEVMVIGGAALYQQMITAAHRMYLTHVDGEFEGDTWFPAFEVKNWRIVSEKKYAADERNNYAFTIRFYERPAG